MGMTGFDRACVGLGCTPSFSMDGLVKEVYANPDADDYSYAMAA
jgi:hypothetical protein